MNGIELDSDFDLLVRLKRDSSAMITRGLMIGDTTYQNQAVLLKAHKGQIKQYPTVGIGIEDIVNDNDFNYWKRLITEELEKDGQKIEKLNITSDGLELKAEYK